MFSPTINQEEDTHDKRYRRNNQVLHNQSTHKINQHCTNKNRQLSPNCPSSKQSKNNHDTAMICAAAT